MIDVLQKLKELESKATPGPWDYSHNGMTEPPSLLKEIKPRKYQTIAKFHSKDDDAIFVAQLRCALPKLLKTIEIQQNFVERITRNEDMTHTQCRSLARIERGRIEALWTEQKDRY